MNEPEFQEKSEEARKYIKENKKYLIEKFVGEIDSCDNPFSIFMAGSPGAGKTETSKKLIEKGLIEKHCNLNSSCGVVRIDADEIREIIPGYDGKNSDLFQSAIAKGVDILVDFVLKNGQNMLLDGTFSNIDVARRNVEVSLKKDRDIAIFYMHQNPLKAWMFTKIREEEEGRTVPKDVFIKAYFLAKENVNQIKKEFGSKVKLYLIQKEFDDNYNVRFEKMRYDIGNIDSYLKLKYNNEELNEILC